MTKLRLVTSDEDFVEIDDSLDFSQTDYESMKILEDFQCLLDNKDEYIQQFKPNVKRLMDSYSDVSKGPFALAHRKAVENLITNLIKQEVIKHMNLTPEQILIICEKSVIEDLVKGYYNLDNYND